MYSFPMALFRHTLLFWLVATCTAGRITEELAIKLTTSTTITEGGSHGSSTTASLNGTMDGGSDSSPEAPDPCAANPCSQGSTCESRANQSFVCLCLAGDYYSPETKGCGNAKVFPVSIALPELTYTENLKDKTSTEFQSTSQSISNGIYQVFNHTFGYLDNIVVSIRPITNLDIKSGPGVWINATVEIIFDEAAEITSDQIQAKIEEHINSSSDGEVLSSGTVREESLCILNPCDMNSTSCSANDGSYTCGCNTNYIKSKYSDRMCTACPSGTKAKDFVCVNCPFGYSGFNCEESWHLRVIIISSVLGGLLLITLILLPIVACKCSKSSKQKKNADTGKPYISHSPAKSPVVNSSLANSQSVLDNGSPHAFANNGVPRIPQAMAPSSWDSRTNLEMTPSYSQQNLIPTGRNLRHYDDLDDMAPYGQTRPQISLYPQARPQNNPSAFNQRRINPYA